MQEIDEPRLKGQGPVPDPIKLRRQEIRGGTRECDEIRRDTRRYEEIRGKQSASEEIQGDTRNKNGNIRKYEEIRGDARRYELICWIQEVPHAF